MKLISLILCLIIYFSDPAKSQLPKPPDPFCTIQRPEKSELWVGPQGYKELECKFSGFPKPLTIYWELNSRSRSAYHFFGPPETFDKEGIKLNYMGLTVDAKKFLHERETFTCVAINFMGNEDRIEYTVNKIREGNVELRAEHEQYSNGMRIKLSCHIDTDAYDLLSVQWFKEGKLISTDDRTEVRENTLTIPSARVEDSGEYICSVKNTRTQKNSSMTLSVKEQVPVKVNILTQQKQWQEGSNISMTCDVVGFPIPGTINWYKDDKPLPLDYRIKNSDVKTLEIHGAYRSDSGQYRCEAINEFSNDSQSVTINVTKRITGRISNASAPVPFCTIQKPEDREVTVYGWGKTNLVCNVTAYPKPTIRWHKDNYGWIESGDEEFSIHDDGHLTIPFLKYSTAGTYTCVADNGVEDIDRLSYKLEIEEQVNAVARVVQEYWRGGSDIKIVCSLWGNPLPEVYW